jgi:hypothetical protein
LRLLADSFAFEDPVSGEPAGIDQQADIERLIDDD